MSGCGINCNVAVADDAHVSKQQMNQYKNPAKNRRKGVFSQHYWAPSPIPKLTTRFGSSRFMMEYSGQKKGGYTHPTTLTGTEKKVRIHKKTGD